MLLKRRHANDQQYMKIMLNFTSHQRNENQNHNKIHFIPLRMAIFKKEKK
jgi:hypothetical protein